MAEPSIYENHPTPEQIAKVLAFTAALCTSCQRAAIHLCGELEFAAEQMVVSTLPQVRETGIAIRKALWKLNRERIHGSTDQPPPGKEGA